MSFNQTPGAGFQLGGGDAPKQAAPSFGLGAGAAKPTFGTPSATSGFGGGFSFGGAAAPASTAFSLPAAASTPSSGFSFGTSAAPVGAAPAAAPSFGVAATSQAPSFGTAATSQAPSFGAAPTATSQAPSFGLGSTTSLGFSLGSTPAAAVSAAAPTAGTGFTLGSTATSAAPSAFSLGGNAAPAAAPTASAAPAAATAGFSLPVASSAPSGVSGFGFGTPSSTPASTGLTLGSVATTPASAGFSLGSTAPSTSTTGVGLLGATTAAATAAPPASSTTSAVSFNFPASSATTTPSFGATSAAPSLTFNLGGAPASTATTAGTTTNTTQPSQSGPITSLNFVQLEETINKWTMDLEEQEKLFMLQATQVNAWDRLLTSNGEKIEGLNRAVEAVKMEQQRLDNELEFICSQQRELEDCLVPLEKELAGNAVTDPEREHTYELSANMDTQLKQMSEDLKEIIENLNERNRAQDSTDPLVQIGRILNSHMDSLQWIEHNTHTIQTHLDQVSKLHESHRRDNEISFHLTYD